MGRRAAGVLAACLITVLVARTLREATARPIGGLVLGIEDGTTKVFREPGRFRGARTAAVALSLARHEAESFQIALLRERDPVEVAIAVSDLQAEQGDGRISASDISIYEVGFVRTTRPAYAVEHVGWWPDPLTRATRFTAPAGQVQPVWVTVRTREDTPPGRYRGTLTLRPSTGETVVVPLEVTVWDFVIPATGHLQTAFDIYPNRLRQAYERLLPDAFAERPDRWEHLEALIRQRLLEARLSPMWHADPADAQTQQAIAGARAQGLTAFAVGMRGGSFDNNWPRDPDELAEAAAPYRRMAEALRAQGWLETAYLYAYDEPAIGDPHVAQVAAAVHRADPSLRTLVALGELRDPSQHADWWRDLDIICLRNSVAGSPHAGALRAMGKEVWLYVSGPTGKFPTLVIDAPAMAARILPWMCWKAGARGLLYWCVNYWTTDPWTEPRNTPWGQHGNGSLLYPAADGPAGSIRLEALRDGMEDYEYLARLQELVTALEADSTRAAGRTAQLAEARNRLSVGPHLVAALDRYSRSSDNVQQERRAIARLIERLQE